MEQLESTNIFAYWPSNPAFDPKRILLCRLFFINLDRPNTCLLVSTPLANINRW